MEYLWLLENRCNYDCPYCSYTTSAERPRLVAMQKGVEPELWEAAWDRAARRDGEGWVYVTGGGEPTLHPHFARLALSVSSSHKLSFDTNLSWSRAALTGFLAKADPARVKLELSFHPSDVSLEEFVAKALLVKSAGFDYQCRWVAFPAHFDRLPGYARRFSEAGLLFTATPYQGRGYPARYTPGQRDAIMAAAEAPGAPLGQIAHLLNEHVETPEGRLCRAGKDYLCVMPDGTTYRCQQYAMRGWEPLGNFLEPDFAPAPASARCRSRDCGHEYRWLEQAVAA